MDSNQWRLFCDIETSGLEPISAVPLEIGMMLDKSFNDPEPVIFTIVVKPTEAQWQLASPRALEVNGFTWERCQEEGLPIQEAADKLCAWLVEHGVDAHHPIYIGQNPRFDLKFIGHYFGPKLRFLGIDFGQPVDVIDMAKQLARVDQTVQFTNFKGASISEALGLPPEPDLHTAEGGIRAVKQNYYALAERLSKN